MERRNFSSARRQRGQRLGCSYPSSWERPCSSLVNGNDWSQSEQSRRRAWKPMG